MYVHRTLHSLMDDSLIIPCRTSEGLITSSHHPQRLLLLLLFSALAFHENHRSPDDVSEIDGSSSVSAPGFITSIRSVYCSMSASTRDFQLHFLIAGYVLELSVLKDLRKLRYEFYRQKIRYQLHNIGVQFIIG